MKFTNKEIIETINVLKSLQEKDLPIAITYKVIDNFDRLIQSYLAYEKTMKKAKTQDEIRELLEIERDVDIDMFDKQELMDSGITLTPAQLDGLKRMIDG